MERKYKKIRDEAIEELRDRICSHFADWQYTKEDEQVKEIIGMSIESVEEIAERMKEAAE